jgi:acyl carrier protein
VYQGTAFDLIQKVLISTPELSERLPSNNVINIDMRLRGDLAFDSLATMILVAELQSLMPSFDETRAFDWQTIGDVVADIHQYK